MLLTGNGVPHGGQVKADLDRHVPEGCRHPLGTLSTVKTIQNTKTLACDPRGH